MIEVSWHTEGQGMEGQGTEGQGVLSLFLVCLIFLLISFFLSDSVPHTSVVTSQTLLNSTLALVLLLHYYLSYTSQLLDGIVFYSVIFLTKLHCQKSLFFYPQTQIFPQLCLVYQLICQRIFFLITILMGLIILNSFLELPSFLFNWLLFLYIIYVFQ